MSFQSYGEGFKNATDLSTRAVTTEGSISKLAPLTSALPTLHRAFSLYISAAEVYSQLLSSSLVPTEDNTQIKRRWRLVLERAEKVKARIEALGGHVRKAVSGAGEEDIIRRRGSKINGLTFDIWQDPAEGDFHVPEGFADASQPELAKEQLQAEPVWEEQRPEIWDRREAGEWVVRQGPGADCSVVAGFTACLAYELRHPAKQRIVESLYPQAISGEAQYSANGKHIMKMMLNGAWRSAVVDSLLPHRAADLHPLYPVPYNLSQSSSSNAAVRKSELAWVPLALKAYFKAHGGYAIRGSSPSADIYAMSGWIPERFDLRTDFKRETQWRRLREVWDVGHVIATLGTGRVVSDGLIPLHAYAILGIRETGQERVLEVFDPGSNFEPRGDLELDSKLAEMDLEGPRHGAELHADGRSHGKASGLHSMTWDFVCGNFESLHLNWCPELLPVGSTRHWYWPKPAPQLVEGTANDSFPSGPQFHLTCTDPGTQGGDVWILLSQHVMSTDRPLDDIALHVVEHYGDSRSSTRSIQHEHKVSSKPFANSVHVLHRHKLKRGETSLRVLPIRDRGIGSTDFSLKAFAPRGATLSLERISQSLPFSKCLSGSLTKRNSGGHSSRPSWIENPQYRLSMKASDKGQRTGRLNLTLRGDSDVPWRAMILWSKGQFATEPSRESTLADSGPYSYGIAYIDVPSLQVDDYTLSVSAFEPGQVGSFAISIESDLPVQVTPIPQEGAGLFHRAMSGRWSETDSGGRPSGGSYDSNRRVEIILPKECKLFARLALQDAPASSIPLNLTLFRRATGGSLGEQVSTSGPYSDSISGVRLPAERLDPGIYVLVPSNWETGMGVGLDWNLKIWADQSFEVES